MLDLQDRFIYWLMNEFYKHLETDMKEYAQNYAKYVQEGKYKDAERVAAYIKSTKEILDDISDENMDPKDFIGLILGKYAPTEP